MDDEISYRKEELEKRFDSVFKAYNEVNRLASEKANGLANRYGLSHRVYVLCCEKLETMEKVLQDALNNLRGI